MISRKESFTCSHCSEPNPVIPKNERNHCRNCLYSLHVDQSMPGDRKADCKNPMEPIYALVDRKKEYIITHRCTSCGHKKRNKVAPDDSRGKIAALIANANRQTYEKNNPDSGKKYGKNS